jgi:hypothetical protein
VSSIVFAGPRGAQPPAAPPAPPESKPSARRSRARKPAAPLMEPAGGDEAEQDEVGEQRAREEAAELERVRARHEAGAPEGQGGQFIGNDPSTPENEAWVLRPIQSGGGDGPAA